MAAWQGSLLDLGEAVEVASPAGRLERTDLGAGAWLERCPGFVRGGAGLYDRLRAGVPWESERRRMYDRVVEVPRLVAFYGVADPLPDPALDLVRASVSRHYGSGSGGPVETVGLCWYRDGRDSVAFHGDRIGRGAREDTLVAIVSLGATRRFLVRPRGGGPARRFELASGDLLVMGGSCQRTFEHAVPKTARAVAGRISIQLRPRGVR